MEGLKRCFVCKEWLSFDNFCKDKNRLDGLQPRCRSCCAECYSRYHKDNREKMVARVAEYHKKNKEKRTIYSKEYYRKNKKELDEKGVEYRKNNKAKSYARGVRYREANKEKVRAQWGERRARKLQQTPQNADMVVIMLYYAVCSETNDILGDTFFHVDHIQPLSKSGLHHEDNLQILEASLNLLKSDKWPLTNEEQTKYRGITI